MSCGTSNAIPGSRFSARPRLRRRYLGAALLLVLAVVFGARFAVPAEAVGTANVWQGDDGTFPSRWSVAANWSLNHVPAGAEIATFDNTATTSTVVIDSAASLALSSGGIEMKSTFAGTIMYSNAKTMTTGADGLVVAGGTFDGDGGSTLPASEGGGASINGGSITVNATGSMTVSGGTFQWPNAASTVSGNYVQSGGTVTVTNSLTFNAGFDTSAGGSFSTTNTVNFRGASSTIDVASSQTFGANVSFGNTDAAVKTIANGDTLIVTGTLTLADGTIAQTTKANVSVSVGGTTQATIQARGAIAFQNAFDDGSTAIVLVNGTGVQALNGQNATASWAPPLKIDKTAGNITGSNAVKTHNDIEFIAMGGSMTSSPTLTFYGTPTYTAPTSLATGKTTWSTINIGDVTTSGTVSVPTGSQLRASTLLNIVNGSVTTSGSGSVGLPGGTSTPPGPAGATGGSLTYASTASAGAAEIYVNGQTAQTITGNATTSAGDINHITIEKAGTACSGSPCSLTLSTPAGTDRIRTSKGIKVGGSNTASIVTTGSKVLATATAATFEDATLQDLEVNGGATVLGTTILNGDLTFTSGKITNTGATLAVAGTITGASSSAYVAGGNLRRTVASGAQTTAFAVGDATNYTPVTIVTSAGVSSGTTTVATATGDHADTTADTSPISKTKSVNRNWTITSTQTGGTRNVTFNWVAGDVDGGATTGNFFAGKKDGVTWTTVTDITNRTSTSLDANGLTSFSEFAIGELTTAADGSGTMTPSPTNVSAGQTGRTITFTYTAATGGMNNGEIKVTVPAGWTAPQTTTSTSAGYVTSSTGTPSAAAGVITVTGVTLSGGSSMTIVYGANAGGGGGATATATTGSSQFTTQQRSTAGGTFTNIGAHPSVTVNAADGAGTLGVATSPATVRAAAPATLTFTYTAPTGGLNNGRVEIAIPAGWTSPQFVSTSAGYTTRSVSAGSADTPGFAGGKLFVDNVTLAATQTLTIVYGDTSASANGAAIPPTAANAGDFTFTTQTKSTSGGTLTTIGASPSVTVNNSVDNSGTMGVAPTTVTGSSTLNDFVFTFTAADGGMKNGRLEIDVPAGFSAPTVALGEGHVSVSGGGSPSIGVTDRTIVVTSVTVDGSNTVTINYDDATAPATQGANTFTTRKKSTPGAAVALAAGSPVVTVVLPPNVPSDLAPAADTWTNDATPQLTARFTDPDGADTGTLDFQICSDVACSTVEKSFSSAPGIINGNLASASPSAPDLGDGDHYWRVRATDSTARSSNYTSTRRIRIDTALPTQALTATAASPASAVFKSGNTIWVKPAATFTVTSTVTDPASGAASATFAALAGTTANATFTGSTDTTPTGGPYESNTVTISGGFTGPATMDVTAADVAGNSSATTQLTIRGDATNPTGSITAPAAGSASNVRGTTVTVSADSADSGSDVGSARFEIAPGDGAGTPTGSFLEIFTDSSSAGGWGFTWNTTAANGCGLSPVRACADGEWLLRVVTTDNVGNSFTSTNRILRVDNTAPSAVGVSVATVSGAVPFLSGNNLFYKGDSAGTFKLSTTVTDATSGPGSASFPALSQTGWTTRTPETISTPDGGPFESSNFVWSAAASGTADFSQVVTGFDRSGNSLARTLTFKNDITGPTAFSPATPAGGAVIKNGQALTASPTDNAGGAGIEKVEYRYCAGAPGSCTPSTLIGFSATGPSFSVTWNGQPADGEYELQARAFDNVGNTTNSSIVSIKLDNTLPTQAFSLQNVGTTSLGYAKAFQTAAKTFVYAGGAAGSLQVRSALADTNPASATFTLTAGGPQFTLGSSGVARTTPGGGNYDSDTLSWGAGSTATATVDVFGTDAAGNNSSPLDTLTFTNDSTNPTGAITAPAAAAYIKGTVAVTASSADTGGAGVKQLEVWRCAGSGCNPFGGTQIGTDTTAAPYSIDFVTGSVADGVYRLGARTVDNVGNVAEDTITVTVDNGPPTQAVSIVSISPAGSISTTGSTVYYRGVAGGNFKVRSVVGDANPDHADFTMSGETTPPWSAFTDGSSTTPGSGTYDSGTITYDPGTSSAPTLDVTGVDRAGNTTTTATLTFQNDSTNPTGGALQCNGGACAVSTYTSPVAVTFTAVADGGSGPGGVRYTLDGTTPTATTGTLYGGSFTLGDGTRTLKYVVFDNVRNTTSVVSQVITVDSAAPALTTSALDGGNKVVLTFGENLALPGPASSAFGIKVGSLARTVTGVSFGANTVTIEFDGTSVATTDTIKFSYTAPVLNPLRDAAGNISASIAETAVGGTGGTPAPAPAAPAGTITAGGNAPLLLTAPPATTSSTSATFSFRGETSSFECSLDGSPFGPCGSPVTVGGLSEGSHSFSVRGVSGGSPTSTSSYTWTIDRTGPTVAKDEGPAALTVDTGPLFRFSSKEQATFMCRVDGGAFAGCSSPSSLKGLAVGDHTFDVMGIDAYGNGGGIVSWSFRIIPPETGGAATTIFEQKAFDNEPGQVSLPDGGATLSWPANIADGLLMTIAEPTGVTVTGGDPVAIVDANAYRLLTREQVTEFSAPLRLEIEVGPDPVVIQVSDDGGKTWRVVPRLDSEFLPANQRDGMLQVGTKAIILLRHLTLFAAVRDSVAPSVPALTGSIASDGLTLNWQPSTDNIGVARYVLLVDGKPATTYGASTLQAKVGPFGPEDTRTFQVAAEDAAGNRSAPSAALRGVPSLGGLPIDQAKTAIEARGFTLGIVTEQESGLPDGTVISQAPVWPNLAAPGQPIDLVVARSASGAAKFVLKVAAAKTVPLKVRRSINVRIQVTRRAHVVAVLRGPAKERIFTWKRQVRAGATILRLKLPTAVKRTGYYTLAIWAAGVGEKQRVVKRVRIHIVGEDAQSLGPKTNPPKTKVEIVLAGSGNTLNLDGKFRVSVARTEGAVFDRAVQKRPVHVLVVDVGRESLALVRDFHLVFPDVPIVAIVPSKGVAPLARWAGAQVVLVRGEPVGLALLRLVG